MRSRWFLPGLLVLAAGVFAAILFLTSYRSFFYDEWDFVTGYRPGSSMSVLYPHNEHWSTIPILVWKLLFVIFGIRTHLPFEAAAIASHVACVVLLFLFVRRHSGELVAFMAALVLLVLGAGAADIVWAFQVAWTLSIAFGLLALLALDHEGLDKRRRIVAVPVLLLCSLMSSGIGLGFLVAVAVQALADRPNRWLVASVVAAFAVYFVWFVLFASALPGTPGASCVSCARAIGADVRSVSPDFVGQVLTDLWVGLTASILGLAGLSPFKVPAPIVNAILPAFAGVLGWRWYLRGRVDPWELGLVAGVVAQFAVIAVTRARFGPAGLADSHYVYVGVVYMLPLAAKALSDVSWRWVWRPLVLGGAAVCIVSNASVLAIASINQEEVVRTQNAELRVVELFRGAPDMALNQPVDRRIMPQLTPAEYYAAIDELGSPIPSSTPSTLDKLDPKVVDGELVTLFGGAMRTDPAGYPDAPCPVFDATAPSTFEFHVLDGQAIEIGIPRGGDVSLGLGAMSPPAGVQVQAHVGVMSSVGVTVPDTGRRLLWRLRVDVGPVGVVKVCGASP